MSLLKFESQKKVNVNEPLTYINYSKKSQLQEINFNKGH